MDTDSETGAATELLDVLYDRIEALTGTRPTATRREVGAALALRAEHGPDAVRRAVAWAFDTEPWWAGRLTCMAKLREHWSTMAQQAAASRPPPAAAETSDVQRRRARTVGMGRTLAATGVTDEQEARRQLEATASTLNGLDEAALNAGLDAWRAAVNQVTERDPRAPAPARPSQHHDSLAPPRPPVDAGGVT